MLVSDAGHKDGEDSASMILKGHRDMVEYVTSINNVRKTQLHAADHRTMHSLNGC